MDEETARRLGQLIGYRDTGQPVDAQLVEQIMRFQNQPGLMRLGALLGGR